MTLGTSQYRGEQGARTERLCEERDSIMTGNSIDRRRLLQGAAATSALGATGLVTAGAAGAIGGSAPAAALPTLRYGSRGAAVKTLQTKLARTGYWLGAADGSFGELTRQAVYAIQKYHRLPRTGVVDSATWAKVNLMQRPVAKHTGYNHIEIDKTRQLLFAYRNGLVQLVVSTVTGSGRRFKTGGVWYDGRTPSGSFKGYRYKPGWYTSSLGQLYRPMFFNGGIAVHGSLSLPPYAASHGCCRVSTAAQNHLLGTRDLRIGGRVVVYGVDVKPNSMTAHSAGVEVESSAEAPA